MHRPICNTDQTTSVSYLKVDHDVAGSTESKESEEKNRNLSSVSVVQFRFRDFGVECWSLIEQTVSSLKSEGSLIRIDFL